MEAYIVILFLNISFIVGPADPNVIVLPPHTQKKVQELKKKIVRINKLPNKADLNGDGMVNFLDLAILAERWLSK